MGNVNRSVLDPVNGLRTIHISGFGGPNNDAFSFVVPDLVVASQRAMTLTALESAIKSSVLRDTRGLQMGCVPEEFDAEVHAMVEELCPSLRLVARPAHAQLFVAPDVNESGPTPLGVKRIEVIDSPNNSLLPWLKTQLGQQYPAGYVDLLVDDTCEDFCRPRVAITEEEEPCAYILQEPGDLSVGALHVSEAWRQRGIGSWLLATMARAILDSQGMRAASLVQVGNEASLRTHARAGWEPLGRPLVWMIYQEHSA